MDRPLTNDRLLQALGGLARISHCGGNVGTVEQADWEWAVAQFRRDPRSFTRSLMSTLPTQGARSGVAQLWGTTQAAGRTLFNESLLLDAMLSQIDARLNLNRDERGWNRFSKAG